MRQPIRPLDKLETDSLIFQELPADTHNSAAVEVRFKISDSTAGWIRWAGRQYMFAPSFGALYTGRQLCDIYDVVGRMMFKLKRERLALKKQRARERNKA